MKVYSGWTASYEFACHSRECRPPGINGGTGGSTRVLRKMGKTQLPGDAGTAAGVIASTGGRALVVGGWVRDQLLGIGSKDIDIEVHGSDPATVRAALEKAGRVDAVGIAFGVLKFGQDVDVSFPRRDSKSGEGHKGFDIVFDPNMTMEEALSRRDFTINSMAFDPASGEIIDPFGGRKDMQDGVLRATDPKAFGDDPLRVMRAVQFASRFGFSIDPATAKLAAGLADSFSQLPKERIWTEWEKILTKGKSLGAAAQALKVTGWDRHFPEFNEVQAHIADRLLKTAPAASRTPAVALGVSFAGNPDGLKSFLKRIDAPVSLRHAATRLSKSSEQLLSHKPTSTDEEARQVARSLGTGTSLRDWLVVHPSARLSAAATRQGILDAPRPPVLTGDHLIGLGRTPGPQFGATLRAAQQAQDVRGWTTTDEALEWLRQQP